MVQNARGILKIGLITKRTRLKIAANFMLNDLNLR